MTLDDADLSLPVPLFPLGGVVLLPRAILPLHIFEPRYRKMTADAMAGQKLIAMAMPAAAIPLDCVTDVTAETRVAVDMGESALNSVVCVGKIERCERLEDGRYNILLEGVCRASIESEMSTGPYRSARLSRVRETPALEIDLAEPRRKLTQFFTDGRIRQGDFARELLRLLNSSMSTADLCDMLAFALLNDAGTKQQLLADGNVARRVDSTVSAILALHPAIPKSAQGGGCGEN